MKQDILEQLFAQYYNDVLLYAIFLSKNKAIAEDLTAQAFFKALQTADGNVKNFKPWLMTVCRNTYFTGYRKHSKNTQLQEYLADECESAIDKIIRDEQYKALYHAITLLPKKQNEVILLFYFENLPISSVAMIMGISVANVKVLLFRARENLKKQLEEQL